MGKYKYSHSSTSIPIPMQRVWWSSAARERQHSFLRGSGDTRSAAPVRYSQSPPPPPQYPHNTQHRAHTRHHPKPHSPPLLRREGQRRRCGQSPCLDSRRMEPRVRARPLIPRGASSAGWSRRSVRLWRRRGRQGRAQLWHTQATQASGWRSDTVCLRGLAWLSRAASTALRTPKCATGLHLTARAARRCTGVDAHGDSGGLALPAAACCSHPAALRH